MKKWKVQRPYQNKHQNLLNQVKKDLPTLRKIFSTVPLKPKSYYRKRKRMQKTKGCS